VDADRLLLKCEELLDLLYANPDHAKLRQLVADIEDLRDQLLDGFSPRADVATWYVHEGRKEGG
jgi:hypothetical protein